MKGIEILNEITKNKIAVNQKFKDSSGIVYEYDGTGLYRIADRFNMIECFDNISTFFDTEFTLLTVDNEPVYEVKPIRKIEELPEFNYDNFLETNIAENWEKTNELIRQVNKLVEELHEQNIIGN